MKKMIQQSSLACALAAAFWVPGPLQAAEAQPNASQDQTNTAFVCQQFLAMQQKLQAESTAQDDELRQLVAQMNSAAPEQKIDAVAAILNKLVEQRLASHQRSQAIEGRVLQHLMQGMIDAAGNGTNAMTQPGTNQFLQPIPAQNSFPSQNAQPAAPQGTQPTAPPNSQSTAPQNSQPILPTR